MKKVIWAIVTAICVITALGAPVFAIEEEAPLLNSDSVISSTAEIKTSVILDQNRTSVAKLSKGTVLNFELKASAHSIYVLWDYPPGEWILKLASGEEYTGGENGFLHEFAELPSDAASFSITVKEDARLCDIFIYGQGETPAFVQKWQPPYHDADILLIPTHADDEHLYFGGTMPYYSDTKKVQVAYLTNHWRENYRPHELLDGLWTVGITAYPVISEFVDAYAETLEDAKKIYNESEIQEFQVELLRRFKPEVVIGHDINGEYGHGAHRLNAASLQKAVEISGDEAVFPQSVADFGAWDVQKTYLHLWAENPIEMDWSIPLAKFDGKTALEMAVEGFEKHTSQQEFFKVRATGPYDCRKFGLYRTTVGNDVAKNDFFENITEEMYSDYLPPKPEPVSEKAASEQASEPASSLPPSSESSTPVNEEAENSPLFYAICGAAIALTAILLAIRQKKH